MLHLCLHPPQRCAHDDGFDDGVVVMPVWAMQVGAVALGLCALALFAFAGAYYLRNRRIALAARERHPEAAVGVKGAGVLRPRTERPEKEGRQEREGSR